AIISRLEALGCKLDEAKNKAIMGTAGAITTDTSKLPAVVIPTNEELMIASETFQLLATTLKK
ncbi:MAG: acetate kinase, partial [Kiritimatiellia bacterium]